MLTALHIVLVVQGMSLSSLPTGTVVSSRVDCVSLCYLQGTCSSIFYDSSSKMCSLVDTVYSKSVLQSTSATMQYWKWETDTCDPEYWWLRVLNTCILLYTGEKSWQDAENQCVQDGAHLVKVDNPEINELMNRFSIAVGWGLWSGGNDKTEEGKWVWADNSVVQEDFWSAGYPDRSSRDTEDCMYVRSIDGTVEWFAERCDNVYKYVCQKSGQRED